MHPNDLNPNDRRMHQMQSRCCRNPCKSKSPVRTSHAINAHQYKSPSKLHPFAEETQRLAFTTSMQSIPVTKDSFLFKPPPNAHPKLVLVCTQANYSHPSILESHVHTIANPTRNVYIYKHLQTKVAAKSVERMSTHKQAKQSKARKDKKQPQHTKKEQKTTTTTTIRTSL